MANLTKTETLEKLNHLEKMVELIFEEIKKMKIPFKKKYMDSLYGIWEGIEISDKDIEEAKKSTFKTDMEL